MSIQTNIRAALFGVALFVSSLANAQQMVIERVGPVLAHPWGMDFLDADTVLVTERGGNLWRIDLASGAARQLTGLPDVFARRQGGLLDVAMADGYVFLCYSAKLDGGSATAIDRAVIEGDRLVRRQTIFIGNEATRSGHHFGCRLWFTAGHLYASLGDRGDRANGQNAASHAGSVIRIASNGDIPFDNPRKDGWAPENYSIGHRNPQGMVMHPGTGAIWTHEHGPRGGDEINIIRNGANYGWPLVSLGREYATGRLVSKYQTLPGFEDPVWVWTPSIAPSGMAFYPDDASGDMFPQFKGHLLVGSLKFRRLYLVELGSEAENSGLPKSERVIIDGDIGRIRDVAVAPHGPFAGSIMLLSDEAQGGLFMARQK
jgi:glucose/arabinose dehydrogenase